jgi:dGTPase
VLGHSTNSRLNTLVHDIVKNSEGKNDICMSPEVEKAMFSLRKYMYEKVYTNPAAKSEEEKVGALIEQLYEYYIHHIDDLPEEFLALMLLGASPERTVCDYIACMSDRYMVNLYKDLMIPKAWSVVDVEHR